MADETKPVEEAPPEFAAFLVKTNKGRTHAALSAGLAEVVRQVKATGKKGTLKLVVTVQPVAKSDTDQLKVTESVDVKPPQEELRASIFFATDDGKLTRDDPNNQEIAGFTVLAREAGL